MSGLWCRLNIKKKFCRFRNAESYTSAETVFFVFEKWAKGSDEIEQSPFNRLSHSLWPKWCDGQPLGLNIQVICHGQWFELGPEYNPDRRLGLHANRACMPPIRHLASDSARSGHHWLRSWFWGSTEPLRYADLCGYIAQRLRSAP